MITLLVTDRNLVKVGDPIDGWTALSVTPQFNAAGAGTVTMPATPAVLDQINADGARLVVIRDNQYFMGGPIEKVGPFVWSLDDNGTSADPGVITVSFTDDFALIAGLITYPDPTVAATAQTGTAQYTASATNAETLLRNLVNLNAGPGALTARQVPKLVLGTVAHVGTNVNVATRFEPLGDVLRSVALAGGNLGFRTIEAGGNIDFTVYDPADLSSQIRFSRGLGNLRSVNYDPAAPTVTVAIVGGDGTGTSRTVREVPDDDAVTKYWRLEQFVNQGSTSDTTVMDQAGEQALSTGGEQAQLTAVAVDTDVQRYGRDYALGDIVTVEIYPGFEVTDIVRAVTLTADPNTGEVVAPLIGTGAAVTTTKQLKLYNALERRVGLLEGG